MRLLKRVRLSLILPFLVWPLLGINSCDPVTRVIVTRGASAGAAELAGPLLWFLWPIITYGPRAEEWLVDKFEVIATQKSFKSREGIVHYNCGQAIPGTPDVLYRKDGEAECNYVVTCVHWENRTTNYLGCPALLRKRYLAIAQDGQRALDGISLRARERAIQRLASGEVRPVAGNPPPLPPPTPPEAETARYEMYLEESTGQQVVAVNEPVAEPVLPRPSRDPPVWYIVEQEWPFVVISGEYLHMFSPTMEETLRMNPQIHSLDQIMHPGERIMLPGDSFLFYVAQGTETYGEIAQRYRMRVSQLMAFNNQWREFEARHGELSGCLSWDPENCPIANQRVYAGQRFLVHRR